MGDINASAAVNHADQHAEIKAPPKNQGTLKVEGENRSVFVFTNTESITAEVSRFLSESYEQLPESLLSLHTFIQITQKMIYNEMKIMELFKELEETKTPEKSTPLKEANSKAQLQKKGEPQPLKQGQQAPAKQTDQSKPYSSLFSLAYSLAKARQQKLKEPPQQQERPQTREKTRPNQPLAFSTPKTFLQNSQMTESRYEKKDQEPDEEQKEGFGGQRDQQQQQEQEEQKKRREVFKIKTSRSVSQTNTSSISISRTNASSTSVSRTNNPRAA